MASRTATTHATLPGDGSPYFLDEGEGHRIALIGQLFSTIARSEDTSGKIGITIASGPAGPPIPAHYHEAIDEAFFVLDGKVRLWLDDQKGSRETKLMTPGDFAWCPARTIHAFQFAGNFTRMLGMNLPGGFEQFFDLVGTPYEQHVLASPLPFPSPEQFAEASAKFDVVYLRDYQLETD